MNKALKMKNKKRWIKVSLF